MGLVNYTKEFGLKSKMLALFPGAWLNKEAEKYLHDDYKSYKKARGKAAWKGLVSPITSAIKLYNVKKLHQKGLSAKQISKIINSDDRKGKRILGRSAELVTAGGVPALPIGAAAGLAHVLEGKRKKFKK